MSSSEPRRITRHESTRADLFGPNGSREGALIRDLYFCSLLTHTEARKVLRALGLEPYMDEWPAGREVPVPPKPQIMAPIVVRPAEDLMVHEYREDVPDVDPTD